MKYLFTANFVLAVTAFQAAARPQAAPTLAKSGCSLNEVLIGEPKALELKTETGFNTLQLAEPAKAASMDSVCVLPLKLYQSGYGL
jgi:hypothetical protein